MWEAPVDSRCRIDRFGHSECELCELCSCAGIIRIQRQKDRQRQTVNKKEAIYDIRGSIHKNEARTDCILQQGAGERPGKGSHMWCCPHLSTVSHKQNREMAGEGEKKEAESRKTRNDNHR